MNIEVLPPEQMEILRRLDACTLANAIETFYERLRNEGFTDHSLHCRFPGLPSMLGHAATVKIRGSAPPTAAGIYSEHTDWWDYVLSLPEPRVVVVQDVASKPGLGAWIGAVHVNIPQRPGLRGRGDEWRGTRVASAAEKLGFQLFSGGVSVSHAYVHIVEFGTPVEVGGLKIKSGDLLHGDLHGVQSIPSTIAARIPAAAAEIVAREQALVTLCQAKNFTVEKLRAAVAKKQF